MASANKFSTSRAVNRSILNVGKVKAETRVKKGDRNASRKAEQRKQNDKNVTGLTEGSLLPKGMRVIGMTSERGESRRKVVIRIKVKNQIRYDHFPVADLAIGEFKSLTTMLAEYGHFELCQKPKLQSLVTEILHLGAANNVHVLTTNGMHELEISGEVHIAYVWGSAAYWFGNTPPGKVVVANSNVHKEASCTADEWNDCMGKYLHGNPYMIVVLVHALSAAVRRLFKQPRTSIALIGESGTGKTTTQQCGQTLTGPIDGVISMSGTKLGITLHLLKHPDCPVYFQDVRQNDNNNNFVDLIFDSADGAGRMKSGEELKQISATMMLSNERLLADMMTGKKDRIDEGVYARLLEIVCCAPHGVFHNLHECDSAAQFADMLKHNSEKCYGAVWPAWINALSENWAKVQDLYGKWLPKVKDRIAEKAGADARGRVNNRILDALAFSAWVGLIASHFKILPIEKDEIVDAFGLVMKEYISRQAEGSTPLTDEIVSAVKGCLDESSGRFPPLSKFNDESQHSIVHGYRWTSKRHGKLFLFLPHVFDRLFKSKFGSAAYGILKETEFLVSTSSHGNQYQTRIPVTGEQKSFIAIKEAIRFD